MPIPRRTSRRRSRAWASFCLRARPRKRGMAARFAAAAILVFLVAPLVAQERPSRAACERTKFTGRGYIECLERHSREAHDALEALVTKIRAAIDNRAELAPVQKTR